MGLRQTHRCLLSFNKIKNKRFRKSVFQRVDECDREVVVAIASAERERNTRVYAYKSGAFYSKMYSKMFPKTLVNISLSRSYTHGGEKIKQTHVPVPAALELRRAVVAKVKAHYSYARKRCGIILVFL